MAVCIRFVREIEFLKQASVRSIWLDWIDTSYLVHAGKRGPGPKAVIAAFLILIQ